MEIAVGVVRDAENNIFITQRMEDSHLSGYWEFPGGKIKQGETPEQALIRELYEEIDIHAHHVDYLKTVEHHYQDRHIILHVYIVEQWDGTPFAKDGQGSRWVEQDEMNADHFPEANRLIIEMLKGE